MAKIGWTQVSRRELEKLSTVRRNAVLRELHDFAVDPDGADIRGRVCGRNGDPDEVLLPCWVYVRHRRHREGIEVVGVEAVGEEAATE